MVHHIAPAKAIAFSRADSIAVAMPCRHRTCCTVGFTSIGIRSPRYGLANCIETRKPEHAAMVKYGRRPAGTKTSIMIP